MATVTALPGERIDEVIRRVSDEPDSPVAWDDVRSVMRANRDFKLEYQGGETVEIPDITPSINYLPPRPEVEEARALLTAPVPFEPTGRTISLSAIDGETTSGAQERSQEIDYRLLTRSGKRFLRPDFGLSLREYRRGRGGASIDIIQRRLREGLSNGDTFVLESLTVEFAQSELSVRITAVESRSSR